MNIFFYPLVGGLCIGISAALFLWLNGKIIGISGIYWGLINKFDGALWRWLFLAGLPIGALIAHTLFNKPVPSVNDSWWLASIGGLLVGIGVKIGSGCTSGHGVCGIGRLSIRSLVATLTFMAVAVLTVTTARLLFL